MSLKYKLISFLFQPIQSLHPFILKLEIQTGFKVINLLYQKSPPGGGILPWDAVFVRIPCDNGHRQKDVRQYESFYVTVSLLYQRTVHHIDHKQTDVRQYVFAHVSSSVPSIEILIVPLVTWWCQRALTVWCKRYIDRAFLQCEFFYELLNFQIVKMIYYRRHMYRVSRRYEFDNEAKDLFDGQIHGHRLDILVHLTLD